ncbi:hypothetical protein KHA80_19515 [Anaerobacillus sp. HL2]|nr:hypothetical protein KHA80_19515 [Anaerobacillus sp. HL2]
MCNRLNITRGFKYPLENARLQNGSSLCISNELIGKSGNLFIFSGILMVIMTRQTISVE